MKHRLIFALIMAMITTSMISFTLIAINVGFTTRFIPIWLRSWSISYVLAVLAMLFIAPRVQVLVGFLLKKHLIADEDDN
ncbi:DUF2798 domain-containing protein [Flavihumibacter solisilvae]|uniref:DUF2798 domain-containing protein n=1 Tax=Flavihumibacter solisilvae TaxID=1349421 RepID=A0A0C1IJN0_9BACT|nr:DUF2798 domain-containing protein [Flavihumibacter solisilvae]KIC94390.1 hypothetical protein OI18_12285 [Flavihumibacter solisilvae]